MTLCPLNGHCDGFYNLLILCHSFYGLKMQQNEIKNIHNSHCDSHTHTQITIHTHNDALHSLMLKICAFNIQNGMRKSIIFTRTNGQTNNRTAPEIPTEKEIIYQNNIQRRTVQKKNWTKPYAIWKGKVDDLKKCSNTNWLPLTNERIEKNNSWDFEASTWNRICEKLFPLWCWYRGPLSLLSIFAELFIIRYKSISKMSNDVIVKWWILFSKQEAIINNSSIIIIKADANFGKMYEIKMVPKFLLGGYNGCMQESIF